MNPIIDILKIAQEISVEDDFPKVVLYHGTFAAYLPFIQKMGLVPRAVDAKSIVDAAIDQIADAYKMTMEQKRELASHPGIKSAMSRITESGFDKIYLSGERSYAEGHIGASGEWFETLLEAASSIVHREFHELKYDYDIKLLALEKVMKRNDKALSQIMAKGDLEEWESKREEFHKVDDEYYRLQDEREKALVDKRREIEEQKRQTIKLKYGEDGVLLTVVMPFSTFVSKSASSFTTERIEEFKAQYARWKTGEGGKTWFEHMGSDKSRVWEFFREVHLRSVETRFIVKTEIMR